MTDSSLLLVTSNGTGMGHLARQVAIALAAKGRTTLFSMSAALPAVTDLGASGEYCPGPDRDWIPERLWAQYLAARIQMIGWEVAANVVMFDGVAPYRGVTLARSRMAEVPFVWFRRGMWQRNVNSGQLWKSELFDAVIEPGDLASDADVGPTASRDDAIRVPPVSLAEVIEPLPRREAASSLGLDPDAETVLVTLGAGRLGDIAQPGAVVMDALLDCSSWQIGLVTSSIARAEIPSAARSRVVPIRGVFPLVRYLAAFDAAVSAAGYNSVHELTAASLPTLLVPNTATRTDDQAGRAREVSRRGLALSADPSSREELLRSVLRLLDENVRSELRARIDDLPPRDKVGGAGETAKELAELTAEFVPPRRTLTRRFLQARDSLKESLKLSLGPSGTNRVRRLLGRPPVQTVEMLDVSTGEPAAGARKLRFLETPSTEQLLESDPVEHLLFGSTTQYRTAREMVAHRFYNIIE
jgi:UDP:flavonoid glycosyltransferase YjiC (YdhE family)